MDELRQAGVENVPNLLHHGDVLEQNTWDSDHEGVEHDGDDGTMPVYSKFIHCFTYDLLHDHQRTLSQHRRTSMRHVSGCAKVISGEGSGRFTVRSISIIGWL